MWASVNRLDVDHPGMKAFFHGVMTAFLDSALSAIHGRSVDEHHAHLVSDKNSARVGLVSEGDPFARVDRSVAALVQKARVR